MKLGTVALVPGAVAAPRRLVGEGSGCSIQVGKDVGVESLTFGTARKPRSTAWEWTCHLRRDWDWHEVIP